MNKSLERYTEAQKYIPGGVNSPVRAFKSVNSSPLFIQWACGSHMYDIDGKDYIDYVGSWGPLILGHTHNAVVEAVQKAALNGTSFGAPTELEVELAKLVCELIPSVDMVRFVNSGTEAVCSAIRLARAYTQKTKIIKFAGCYHGCVDPLLVQAGSGVATLGLPDSPGIPQEVTKDTIILDFNDDISVKEAFKLYGDEIAAVILEPVVGNSGCILPKEGFLDLLRTLCTVNNALLILDEVMTGFRISLGGAQQYFSVIPDITTMGKIIGGGLPVGAYGGRKEIMEMIAPAGPVYQAGTLSGNPIAMAAGLATLTILKETMPYDALAHKTRKLVDDFKSIGQEHSIPLTINQIGSMFSVFFTDQEVIDYNTAKTSNTKAFSEYFNNMLLEGVYLPPSQFETAFMSVAHNDQDLEHTCVAFERSIKRLEHCLL